MIHDVFRSYVFVEYRSRSIVQHTMHQNLHNDQPCERGKHYRTEESFPNHTFLFALLSRALAKANSDIFSRINYYIRVMQC
jgi:hypothetical protein